MELRLKSKKSWLITVRFLPGKERGKLRARFDRPYTNYGREMFKQATSKSAKARADF